MDTLQAAILGLVQGITEFIPVSSSGHLMITRTLLGLSREVSETGAYLMLDILLHIGTLLAILLVFRRDWWHIIKNPIKSKLLLLLFIASLPALASAILFKDFIESFFTGWFLGISFIITSVMLLLAELISRHNERSDRISHKPGFINAIVMGIAQAFALLPGVSRSGMALTGGILSKLDRKSAVKFCFMMSVPAILGSLIVEGKRALDSQIFDQLILQPTLVGMAVAAVSGYFSIRIMLRAMKKTPLTCFALYTALIGLGVLIMQLTGSTIIPPFLLPNL
jgi:undecaprenyl-diphosphatase